MAKTKTRRQNLTAEGQVLGLPGQFQHRQDRSRRTARAILEVARSLIRERRFEEISVGEIAARAGTSVGGFYARFKNKNALLEGVMAAVTLEANAALDEWLGQTKGQRAVEVVRGWTATMVRVFRTHRAEIGEVMRQWPKGPPVGGPIERDSTTLRNRARSSFRRELTDRVTEIHHDAPDIAISVALMMATVTLREAVVGSALPGYGAELSDEDLAYEIGSSVIAYLGLEE